MEGSGHHLDRWTPGSTIYGRVGAACAWRTWEGWTGRRFHLYSNNEVFGAKVFAIYQTLRACRATQESNRRYTIFSDS